MKKVALKREACCDRGDQEHDGCQTNTWSAILKHMCHMCHMSCGSLYDDEEETEDDGDVDVGVDGYLVTSASENSAELHRSVVQRQYLGRILFTLCQALIK